MIDCCITIPPGNRVSRTTISFSVVGPPTGSEVCRPGSCVPALGC